MVLLAIDINNGLVNALCNTLVHSLWQGLLLAVAAGLIVVYTRRFSAALRYKLLVSALMLFAVGVLITFIAQFTTGHAIVAAQLTGTLPQATSLAHTLRAAQAASLTNILSGYLHSYSNTIVLIWFLIICAKSIRLGVGLHGTYRLKYVNAYAAGNHWQARMQQLAATLGIKRGVQLLESGLAKVPLVIGHLKPVILVPAGLLTSLTPAEIEAILMHELAHISRRDYLVNLLQSLMEIIFFFNPAVLWISELIKTERENCCDDLAIKGNTSKANYIRALLSCEEYRSVPAHAMAFPGNKHSLLHRVKRMAGNRNHSLSLFEKTLLAVCLVISGICMSAFAKKQPVKLPPNTVVVVQDTVPAERQHQAIVSGQNGLAAIDTSIQNKPIPVVPPNSQQTREAAKLHDNDNPNISGTGGSSQRNDYYAGAKDNYDSTAKRYSGNVVTPRVYAPPPQAYIQSAYAYTRSAGQYNYSRTNGYPGASPPFKTEREKINDAMLYEIMADMVHDGIIKERDNLEFKLSAVEFIVNGQQQDGTIFQRYKSKYVPADNSNNWTWTISRHLPRKA